MDELLRNRLGTTTAAPTTVDTIFNQEPLKRFEDDSTRTVVAPSSVLVRPLLDDDAADLVANKKKYGQKRYDQRPQFFSFTVHRHLLTMSHHP